MPRLRRVNHELGDDLSKSNFSSVKGNHSLTVEGPSWTLNEEKNYFIDNPCNTLQETTLYSTNEDCVLAFPGLAPQLLGKKVFHIVFLGVDWGNPAEQDSLTL